MARLMRTYVAHRQMLPDIAPTISSSVGFGVFARSDAACMICPDWQYPHCGTCSAIQASWSGCRPSGCKPSIVVIFLPAACATVVWHERTALPSRCTVQAPHCATPQPNFVPVIFKCSRMTHNSGVEGSTSTVWLLPLIRSVAIVGLLRGGAV